MGDGWKRGGGGGGDVSDVAVDMEEGALYIYICVCVHACVRVCNISRCLSV